MTEYLKYFPTVMYSCGHLYHASCLGISGLSGQALAACCVVCNKAAAHKTRSSQMNLDTVSHWIIMEVME